MLADIERDPATAPLDECSRALVNYALKLTRSPGSITEDDITALREAGLSDAAIHDVTAISAYYNFVNRIALGLGVELENEYNRGD